MGIKDHEQSLKVGKEYLKKTSEDVTGWFWFKQDIADLEEYSQEVNKVLKEIRSAQVQAMLANGALSKDQVISIASNISMVERGPFVVSDILSETLNSREVDRLKNGRSFLPQTNVPKVIGSLTVAKPDAVRAYKHLGRKDVSQTTALDAEQMQIIDEGTVIEGRVTSFSSNPDLAGAIAISPLFDLTHVVCGLVDPRSGEPNVTLELLGL